MVREFKLPDVGEGIAEGEVVRWLVEVGDSVAEDQPVVEVETDKALVELPSPVDGTVAELRAAEGDIVQVGEVIIVFEIDGEEAEAGAPPEPEESGVPSGTTAGPDAPGEASRVFAPPHVRRLARELDVDLSTVAATGPRGRVTETDVRAAAEDTGETDAPNEQPVTSPPEVQPEPDAPTTGDAGRTAGRERTLAVPAARRVARELDVDIDAVPATEERDGEAFVTEAAVRQYAETLEAGGPAEPAAAGEPREERIPYRGVRRTIGDRMTRSKFTAPHVTHHDAVAVQNLVDARAALRERAQERGITLTYIPFVLKAVVGALKEHPSLNASLDEETEEIVLKHHYDIGVAVATDHGLVVPVVEAVDEKGLLQLASEVNELAEKARDRTIGPEELRGSTFSITNFGAIGGEYATPIINYPEVAVLGLGEIKDRPVVEDGEVVARPTLPLSLTIDHRVVDGAEAAAFTNRVMQYLADPTHLLIE